MSNILKFPIAEQASTDGPWWNWPSYTMYSEDEKFVHRAVDFVLEDLSDANSVVGGKVAVSPSAVIVTLFDKEQPEYDEQQYTASLSLDKGIVKVAVWPVPQEGQEVEPLAIVHAFRLSDISNFLPTPKEPNE